MVAVGLWTRRKAVNQEEFLVAGRSVGPLLYSGTLAAIIIGGGATVGGVKLGYTYGLSGMWLVSMYGVGLIVMGLVLVPGFWSSGSTRFGAPRAVLRCTGAYCRRGPHGMLRFHDRGRIDPCCWCGHR